MLDTEVTKIPDSPPPKRYDPEGAWAESREYQALFGTESTWKESAGVRVVGAVTLLITSLFLLMWGRKTAGTAHDWLVIGGTTLIAIGLWYLIGVGAKYGAARRQFYDRVRLIKAQKVEEAIAKVRDGDLALRDLFTLNRRQLDEYHTLSVRQASIAFRNAQAAAIVGFLILVAGAIIAIQQDTAADKWVAAGLSGLGTTLSGFISAVFFKSYSDTRALLGYYYREPYLMSRTLGAERLAATKLDPDLRQQIVTAVLAEKAPPLPGEEEEKDTDKDKSKESVEDSSDKG